MWKMFCQNNFLLSSDGSTVCGASWPAVPSSPHSGAGDGSWSSTPPSSMSILTQVMDFRSVHFHIISLCITSYEVLIRFLCKVHCHFLVEMKLNLKLILISLFHYSSHKFYIVKSSLCVCGIFKVKSKKCSFMTVRRVLELDSEKREAEKDLN